MQHLKWKMSSHVSPHFEDTEGTTHCLTDYLCRCVSPPRLCDPNNEPWVTQEVKASTGRRPPPGAATGKQRRGERLHRGLEGVKTNTGCRPELWGGQWRVTEQPLQVVQSDPAPWKASYIVPALKKDWLSEQNDFQSVAFTSHLMKPLPQPPHTPGAPCPVPPAGHRCWWGGSHSMPG